MLKSFKSKELDGSKAFTARGRMYLPFAMLEMFISEILMKNKTISNERKPLS